MLAFTYLHLHQCSAYFAWGVPRRRSVENSRCPKSITVACAPLKLLASINGQPALTLLSLLSHASHVSQLTDQATYHSRVRSMLNAWVFGDSLPTTPLTPITDIVELTSRWGDSVRSLWACEAVTGRLCDVLWDAFSVPCDGVAVIKKSGGSCLLVQRSQGEDEPPIGLLLRSLVPSCNFPDNSRAGCGTTRTSQTPQATSRMTSCRPVSPLLCTRYVVLLTNRSSKAVTLYMQPLVIWPRAAQLCAPCTLCTFQ